MSLLNQLGITIGKKSKAASVFEKLLPSFLTLRYKKPSEYIIKYWEAFEKQNVRGNSLNGKVFEYVLATLFVREGIMPIYISAKVAFVPNVKYDLMFYTDERGPICISAKTSLRERYKQADLEAVALKYVHRKALNYLVTMHPGEAALIKEKISTGEAIGLDDVILATSDKFDKLIEELKAYRSSTPPTVTVIESNQIITQEKLQAVRAQIKNKK